MGRKKQRGAAASQLADPGAAAAERTTAEPAADKPASAQPIGRYLAREREVREISLDELAALTRLPLRSLQRLEAGHFDGIRDGFTRGLVRTVAEALGLNVDDTLARMLPEAERVSARVGISLPLRWLRLIPIVGWLAGAGVLVALAWFSRGVFDRPPEPLLYRQDAVRELWLLQQQHSSWSPAPALTTSPVPTVEPEDFPSLEAELRDEP